MGLSFPYNLANGTTADADEVMANFNEIKNNFNQDTIEDASANATEFQATKLPDTGSLPTSGREELQTLRYQFKVITGKTNWDDAPSGTMVDDTSTQTIAGPKTFTNTRVLSTTTPTDRYTETDASADNKIWEQVIVGEQLRLRIANDALDTFGNIFTVDRTGTTVDLLNILSTALQHNGVDFPISGTYTPTATPGTNCSSATPKVTRYSRIGNIVTVSGQVNVDPSTVSIYTAFTLSLPIASALANNHEVSGSGVSSHVSGLDMASISANATTDTAVIEIYPTNGSLNTLSYVYTYEII